MKTITYLAAALVSSCTLFDGAVLVEEVGERDLREGQRVAQVEVSFVTGYVVSGEILVETEKESKNIAFEIRDGVPWPNGILGISYFRFNVDGPFAATFSSTSELSFSVKYGPLEITRGQEDVLEGRLMVVPEMQTSASVVHPGVPWTVHFDREQRYLMWSR